MLDPGIHDERLLPTLPDRLFLSLAESLRPKTGDVPDEIFLIKDLMPRACASLNDLKLRIILRIIVRII